MSTPNVYDPNPWDMSYYAMTEAGPELQTHPYAPFIVALKDAIVALEARVAQIEAHPLLAPIP